jgi:integrase/recombinase XerC
LKPRKINVPLSKDKLQEVLNAEFTPDFSGLRDRLVLEILYGTGIRVSELVELKNEDVDLEKMTIKVLGKGKKWRICPLFKNLVTLMSLYIEEKKKLEVAGANFIVTSDLKPTYRKYIYRITVKYLSEITTGKRSPHMLRHAFATHLLDNGVKIEYLKELLGHSTIASTQHYTHSSIEHLKKNFFKSHPKS